jgi:uncharacterized metal-binding protein
MNCSGALNVAGEVNDKGWLLAHATPSEASSLKAALHQVEALKAAAQAADRNVMTRQI